MRFLTQCRRAFALAFCLLALQACVSAPERKAEVPPRPLRETIQSFSLIGRASIRQPQSADTMRLVWEHTPRTDAMGFASPLGHMMAELQRDASGARWHTAAGERYESPNADLLLARLTDVPVPINALSLWVIGRTSAGSQGIQRDAMGRLTEANDRGWLVKILAYESDVPNALPSLVEVDHGNLRIRLAIEEWQIE